MRGIDTINVQLVLLTKSLYDIRLAPKLIHQCFAQIVKATGLCQARWCNYLFTSSGSNPVYFFVYVADLIILGSKEAFLAIKENLGQLFTLTELGAWFLFF